MAVAAFVWQFPTSVFINTLLFCLCASTIAIMQSAVMRSDVYACEAYPLYVMFVCLR